MTASKIPIKKVCEHCKQEFVAWKTTTKYCSHQCNSRAYKSKRREERVQRTEVNEQEKKVKDLIDKPYLSIAEAGRLLGISRHTIYSRPLKTIFQHKVCTDKLYADSFYKVQKSSHSSFEVICCRS